MPSLPGASVEADRAMDEGESPDGPSKGDACQNGPMPQLPGPPSALSPTKSPVGPDAPPGVAGFHDNLRKSQGTSAEGSVRKEALQSLRRSLPMQETQLCKHPTRLLPLSTLPSARQSPPPEAFCLVTMDCAFIVWLHFRERGHIFMVQYSWWDSRSRFKGPVCAFCHPGW